MEILVVVARGPVGVEQRFDALLLGPFGAAFGARASERWGGRRCLVQSVGLGADVRLAIEPGP